MTTRSDKRVGPLCDVRVLDLSRFPPGASCSVLLADLGADVIRVDRPGADGAAFGVGVTLSRGKRSLGLDLRHPQGINVLRRLAGSVDVLVEDDRPDAFSERGFGYADAARECPELIWCSITGFGQDGPYATRSGHDLTYTAHAGLLTAIHPELPWHPHLPLTLPLGAIMATTGIVAAIRGRDRSGAGCHVDISLAEAGTWALGGNDGELSDSPWDNPVTPDRRLYVCKDGHYVTVAATEPRTWAALCQGLGLPELAEEPVPVDGRSEGTTEQLAAVFMTRPATEWVDMLGAIGAAVGSVNRGSDVMRDPQVQARGSVVWIKRVPVPISPIRLRDAKGPLTVAAESPPPAIGADTETVLRAAGFDPSEIASLRANGVVVAAPAGLPEGLDYETLRSVM